VILVLGLAIAWIGGVAIAVADGRRPTVGWTAVGLLAAHVAALAVLLGVVLTDGPREVIAGGWPEGVGIRLRADALGALFALTSAVVLLAALAHEVATGARSRTTPALVLLLAAGLSGLFLTGDVFSFYVFFELAMIAAYSLTATGGTARELGSAFIFAVVNLLGSFLFLIGIGSLYHVTGSLDMVVVAERMATVDSNSAILIAVTFFVAFSVKLGLFPFHFWLPAVYCSARPAVAAILSGALANIGSYGLLRFGADLLPEQLELASLTLLVLGTVSIVYGALQALSRRTLSEVLAYSAIGQAGYILVAIAVAGPVGLYAAVLYAVVNALNKALLFLVIDLRGWLVGAAFALGAFSVAGVPPAAGFLGKLGLFQTGIEEGSVALVVLIFAGGALSFVYMFQAYQVAFWRPDADRGRSPRAACSGPPRSCAPWPCSCSASGPSRCWRSASARPRCSGARREPRRALHRAADGRLRADALERPPARPRPRRRPVGAGRVRAAALPVPRRAHAGGGARPPDRRLRGVDRRRAARRGGRDVGGRARRRGPPAGRDAGHRRAAGRRPDRDGRDRGRDARDPVARRVRPRLRLRARRRADARPGRERPRGRPRALARDLPAPPAGGVALMHDLVFYVAVIWMTGLLGVSVVLVVRANRATSRILALDMLVLILVALLILYAADQETALYLDAALLLAILSFTATLAAARFHARGRVF
jgi:multicomponent Na+:H+ antiporter subunit D